MNSGKRVLGGITTLGLAVLVRFVAAPPEWLQWLAPLLVVVGGAVFQVRRSGPFQAVGAAMVLAAVAACVPSRFLVAVALLAILVIELNGPGPAGPRNGRWNMTSSKGIALVAAALVAVVLLEGPRLIAMRSGAARWAESVEMGSYVVSGVAATILLVAVVAGDIAVSTTRRRAAAAPDTLAEAYGSRPPDGIRADSLAATAAAGPVDPAAPSR